VRTSEARWRDTPISGYRSVSGKHQIPTKKKPAAQRGQPIIGQAVCRFCVSVLFDRLQSQLSVSPGHVGFERRILGARGVPPDLHKVACWSGECEVWLPCLSGHRVVLMACCKAPRGVSVIYIPGKQLAVTSRRRTACAGGKTSWGNPQQDRGPAVPASRVRTDQGVWQPFAGI